MTEPALKKLQYPIGSFVMPSIVTPVHLAQWIAVIRYFPEKLRSEVNGLSDVQLDTRYRPGGWTIRQVVHHCADSHMNAFIRLKLALTEENPAIKPYMEARWAEHVDEKEGQIQTSLKILEGLHERWADFLETLNEGDWKRTFIHPEKGRALRLDENTGMYAWHCDHHLAHITTCRNRKDWK
jgi:hypothetical protein